MVASGCLVKFAEEGHDAYVESGDAGLRAAAVDARHGPMGAGPGGAYYCAMDRRRVVGMSVAMQLASHGRAGRMQSKLYR